MGIERKVIPARYSVENALFIHGSCINGFGTVRVTPSSFLDGVITWFRNECAARRLSAYEMMAQQIRREDCEQRIQRLQAPTAEDIAMQDVPAPRAAKPRAKARTVAA